MAELQTSVFSIMGNNATLSSIIGIIKHHLQWKFPKGYFRYTYIRNSFASITEANIDDEKELIKERPILALNMSTDYQDAQFAGDSILHCRSFLRKNAYSYPDIYKTVLICEQDRLFISGFEERTKVNFEVGIKVDTEAQASNIVQFIRGQFGINRPYYISNALLEVPIPGNILNKIIAVKEFNVSTPEGIREFHSYLTMNSGGRITYKKNLSSGRYLYFYKYMTNILCKIGDNPSISKNLENKSVIEATVTFGIEVEFHNFLHFVSEYEKFIDDNTPEPETIIQEENSVIYNYTMSMPIQRQLSDGKTLIHVIRLVTNIEDSLDITDFSSELTGPQKEFFSIAKKFEKDDPTKYNGLFSSLVTPIVYRDDEQLSSTNYNINWDNYTLEIVNPLKNYVYAFAIYIDIQRFNKLFDDYHSIYNTYSDQDKIKEIL